jgi:hypothetical protein
MDLLYPYSYLAFKGLYIIHLCIVNKPSRYENSGPSARAETTIFDGSNNSDYIPVIMKTIFLNKTA